MIDAMTGHLTTDDEKRALTFLAQVGAVDAMMNDMHTASVDRLLDHLFQLGLVDRSEGFVPAWWINQSGLEEVGVTIQ